MAKVKIPNEVRETVNNTRKEEFLQLVKEKLNGEQAVAFYGNHYRAFKTDFLIDGQHVKVLPVRVIRKEKKVYTGYYVAFDVDRIELNSEVELKAPKEKTRMIVGTNAWQVAYLCRRLGLKSIKVVGV